MSNQHNSAKCNDSYERGKRITTMRKQKRLTQNQLAGLISKKRVTISRIENGNEPLPETLKKLADALGTTMQFLYYGKNSPDSSENELQAKQEKKRKSEKMEEYDLTKLKDRIKKIREDIEYTQEELAFEIGVERALISQYERGDCIPKVKTLAALAKLGNVTLDALWCGYHVINNNGEEICCSLDQIEEQHIEIKKILQSNQINNEEAIRLIEQNVEKYQEILKCITNYT